MPEQLPGANVLAVVMQAPMDIMGLASRQITEAVDTFGVGMERLGAELAVPPDIAGLALPPLPGMAPAGAPPAGAPAAAPAVGIQGRAATRRGLRPKLIV
jgi:hypothetical protein